MYSTASEFVIRFGPREIAQIAGSDDYPEPVADHIRRHIIGGEAVGVITSDVERQAGLTEVKNKIESAISRADSTIDLYLTQGGYETPLSVVPSSIWGASLDLAREDLHQDQDVEHVTNRANAARSFLEMIRDGKVTIPSVTLAGEAAPEVLSRDQVFGETVLADY